MAGVPGEIDEEAGPPSHVPLLHFVVALAFLAAGTVLGVSSVVEVGPASDIAHVHALLAGWICITIMGAMTQFVPVWSDATLHSRFLARLQLSLVTVGVAGMVAAASLERFDWFYLPGVVAAVGFWVFSYNVLRTLPSTNPFRLDVTELQFLVALIYVVLATAAGVSLGLNTRYGFLASTSIEHGDLVSAHAAVAVYGFVVSTVAGAIYQLATLFTQTELTKLEHRLQDMETAVYPVAPALLAFGYLSGNQGVVTLGFVLIVVGLGCLTFVVARKLWTSQMDVVGHPMLARYAVAVSFLAAWLAAAAWRTVRRGEMAAVFGSTGTSHVFFVGFLAFVVVGTLYHVVPFLIWIHRYSDLLGFEKVPLVDDLYSERVERVELVATTLGAVMATAGLVFGVNLVLYPGVAVLSLGYCLFVCNVIYTVDGHHPGGVAGVLTSKESAEERALTSKKSAEEGEK